MMLKQRTLARGRAHPRHRFPRAALWISAGLVAALVAWMVLGIPSLVKYPTDLEADQAFEGTFTVLVDPTSAAPLAEPLVLPLEVERHIEVIGAESGANEVVVRETIQERAGDLIDVTQVNQYVMDRSTVENLADERAYSFEPENVVDRSGAYRLHLPFDTSRGETYTIYSPETDTTYTIAVDPEQPTSEVEGLTLSNFLASATEVPVTEAYLQELGKAVPLPRELTLEQMKPQLLAAGIDVDAVLAALMPVLTPEDTAILAGFAEEPIGLEYVLSFGGRLGVEPVTGAEVQVSVSESMGARPQLGALPVLLDLLGRYPQVPEAVTAAENLQALAEGPAIPLFEYEYDQTPASVAEVADEAAAMRTQVLLAKVWLPVGLALAALLTLGIGTVVFLRRRPRPLDLSTLYTTPPVPHPADEARPTVPTGR